MDITIDLELPPACPAPLLTQLVLAHGNRAMLRPMLPRDAQPLQHFVAALSEASRQQRFRGGLKNLSDAAAHWLTTLDYESRMAYVVTLDDEDGATRVIAEARWAADERGHEAEFSLAVADAWQGQGLAPLLMDALERAARTAGVSWLRGEVHAGNSRMLALMRRCGFSARTLPKDASCIVMRKRVTETLRPEAAGWLGALWWRLAPTRTHALRLN
jgi:acetyltransferase